MRRLLSSLVLMCFGVLSFAQTAYDGLMFSENNYTGTAKTMSMGNAFTALGGDLGGIGINPAGSAVANYSQFTITGGANIAVSASAVALPPSFQYGNNCRSSITRATIPNVGLSLNFDTKNPSGLKNVALGFSANTTSSFLDNVYSYFGNDATSYCGYMASVTTDSGYSKYELDRTYNPSAYNNYPTDLVLGWNSGMTGTPEGEEYTYVGATEQYRKKADGSYDIWTGGPLDQRYGRQCVGSKYDYVFNVGLNFNNKLYIGGNLGITGFNYSYDDYFREDAQDYTDFPIAENLYFTNMKYTYYYDAKGSGVYAKIGAIFRPTSNIRIGAAVQTPTAMVINEDWGSSGYTLYTDQSYDSKDAAPEGAFKYRFIAPFRANVGIAATFPMGLISVDYEICNYKSMRFKEFNTSDNTGFEMANGYIQDIMGVQHNLRAGIEVKPVKSFAIRAGYSMLTSPEKAYTENSGNMGYTKALRHAPSLGFGWSSRRSFFIDAAVRATIYSSEYLYPYGDYLYDMSGCSLSPEIVVNKTLWTAILTFGFRF